MAQNLEDFDALVAELLEQQGAEGAEKDKAKAPEGFQLHLGGKDYKFGTREEAERALETHMARLETTAKEATARAEAAAKPPEPVAPPLKEGEVDPRVKAYVNALEKGDFKEMTRIQLNHGLFDGKVDDPQSVINNSLLQTAKMDRSSAVNTFLSAHTDLASNQQAQSVVEQARTFLGLPATPDGFEAAHAYAERKQLIPASVSAPTKPGAPPAPPRGAATGSGSVEPQTPEEWESFYNSQSDENLEKLMKRAYAQR